MHRVATKGCVVLMDVKDLKRDCMRGVPEISLNSSKRCFRTPGTAGKLLRVQVWTARRCPKPERDRSA